VGLPDAAAVAAHRGPGPAGRRRSASAGGPPRAWGDSAPRPEATRGAGPCGPAPPPRPGTPPAGAARRWRQRLARPPRSASTPHPRAAPATAATGRARPRRPGCSWALLALPDLADQPQPALDRAQGTAQAGGDLRDRVALHLPDRDSLEIGVAQPAQQQAARLGHLGGELGRRLPAGELIQSCRRRIIGAEQTRLAQNGPAAALLAALVADQAVGLALGEGDQQP